MANGTSAPKKVRTDVYANVAFGAVTMSAANTLTFAQIQMAVGLFQGVALVIHRLKYRPTRVSIRELAANTDELTLALTTSNRLSAINDVADPAIIDQKVLVGVGASVEPVLLPLISDFTMLPGGGKIISANPLFLGMTTLGAAAASVCRVEMEFTFVSLTDRDYLEIIQSQFPANIS